MKHPIVRFFILLIVLVVVSFSVQMLLSEYLGLMEMKDSLVYTYLFNFLFALFAFVILYLLRKKYESSLGFIFMVSSFLKFGFFFVIFHPLFKVDGVVSKYEFLAFFIPYSVCLIAEIYSFAKVLNKQ